MGGELFEFERKLVDEIFGMKFNKLFVGVIFELIFINFD